MKNKSRAITKFIGELRVISDATREDHDRIINWVDGHYFANGNIGKSLVFILPTRACKYARAKHGGCSFCTLPTDNPFNPSDEMLNALPERCEQIFNEKRKEEETIKAAKFYTSGSFLDPWEVPLNVREEILRRFDKLVDEIVVETRCEYVTRKQLDHIIKFINPRKVIIAIGQETADDEINIRSNNKGHKFKQFQRAVKLLKEYNFRIKSYILLKPIFVSESHAVIDAIESGKKMIDLKVDGISINPCYIGKGTLMEELFKRGDYLPPWLWSVAKVSKQLKEYGGKDVIIISDPVAAGQDRGPKNCGKCDAEFRETMKNFSTTQDISLLENLECECKTVYDRLMNVDQLIAPNGVVGFKGH